MFSTVPRPAHQSVSNPYPPREAMAAGVQKSCFVILFLSEGVLERPFVQFEVGEALSGQKEVGSRVVAAWATFC